MATKIAKPSPPALAAPAGRLVFERDGRAVWQGDCLAWLARCEAGRFSACVTDPPYELGFMGRKWDKSGVSFDPETWRAVLRALRPGAHLVAFGGTRTFHRLACAIEDAGFEIRDTLMWVYGSGFPKSLDVSKAIDKAAGAKRKIIGKGTSGTTAIWSSDGGMGQFDITSPATPDAARWQGWGTGLKPSWEPIILARKPLDGTVAECVLRHGSGALNVDGCRIGNEKRFLSPAGNTGETPVSVAPVNVTDYKGHDVSGRWPANAVFQHDARCVRVGERKVKTGIVVCRNVGKGGSKFFGMPKDVNDKRDITYGDASGQETVDLYACVPGCPVRMLDGQSGQSKSGTAVRKNVGHSTKGRVKIGASGSCDADMRNDVTFGDSGGASRFFYTPKASTAERRAGLSMLEDNTHPTVKPVALMEWLLRLVAPPGGEVLDPFAGSGSTLVAAKRLGIPAVGIDLDAEACETAAARLTRRTAKGLGGTKKLKLGKRRRRK